MNRITLMDYTPGAGDNASVVASASLQTNASDDIFHPANSPVCNYASFMGMGINLNDSDIVCAMYSDNIGYITEGFMQTSTTYTYTINFANNSTYTLNKSFCIKLHKRLTNATINCNFYDADDNLIRGVQSFMYESISINLSSNPVEDVAKITISIQAPYAADSNNKFLAIDSIVFGSDVVINDIIGEISVYSEVSLTCDDLPAGNCDVTVISDREPQEGQSFILDNDYYCGKYIIDTVSRKGEDIYAIQGHDDVEELDNWFSQTTTSITQGNLLNDSSVRFSSTPSFSGCTGKLWGKNTVRQNLAMITASLHKGLSAFNDKIGIHFVELGSNTDVPTITADDILGEAEFTRRHKYNSVYADYGLETGTVTESVTIQLNNEGVSAGVYELASKGANSFKPDTITALAENVATYVNGNEVTVTVIYAGQKLGDLVTISTPYNGSITGIIRSIELTMGANSTKAELVIREVTE